MDRVSNLASSSYLMSIVNRSRLQTDDSQLQVATGKVSQNYAGIASKSERLITLETTRSALVNFGNNNDILQGRLDVMDQSLSSIDSTIRDFRSVLNEYGGQTPLDASQARIMQDYAFKALNEIQAQLNTKIDGRYLFGGSQVTTPPFDFGADTLSDFQARYDGERVTIPTTRDASLENFSISADTTGATSWLTFDEPSNGPSVIRSTTASFSNISPGTTIEVSGTPGGTNDGVYTVEAVPDGQTLQVKAIKLIDEGSVGSPVSATLTTTDGIELGTGDTGGLIFDGANDTITAANFKSLADLTVGSIFHVSGSTSNDRVFRVASNDGTTVTIESVKLTAQGGGGSPVAGTISAVSAFKGDDATTNVRLDNDRSVDLQINALDPSFEKAIRAMSIIAQGAPDSEGSLVDHPERIADAVALLTGAVDRAPAVYMPYGAEDDSNLEELRMQLGFNQSVVQETSTRHQDLIASLESGIGDIENVDMTDAITRFLNDSQSLEAALKVVSRVSQLSLVNYL